MKKLHLLIIAFLISGLVFSQTTVKKITSNVAIDGQLDESFWGISNQLSINLGSSNNTASFGVLWDNTYLYVGMNVEDQTLCTNGRQGWHDDGVEIYIDGNYSQGTTFDQHDRLFVKPVNSYWIQEAEERYEGVIYQWIETDNGYSMEFAIPWSNFNISPAVGMNIGFDIAVNDDDNCSNPNNTLSQLLWSGNSNYYKLPSSWGTLTLSAQTVSYSGKYIALTSPNGGDFCINNKTTTVNWVTNDIANISIDCSTDNGNSWNSIATNMPAASGSFSWNVSATPSNQCLIRIFDTDNSSVNDISESPFSISAALTAVEPLITNSWKNYKWPYNAYYPEVSNGIHGHVGNACGASSLARILHYWKYPIVGNDELTFTDNAGNIWSANFGTTTYNYDNMPNYLPENSTEAEYKDVATLIYHAATSMHDIYGSGGDLSNMSYAMSHYFNYKESVPALRRNYTRAEWIQTIQNELDNGRVLLVQGMTTAVPGNWHETNNIAGHWFHVDGYNEDGDFHVVVGYGDYDGYYDANSMYNFTYNLGILTGLEPKSNNSLPFYFTNYNAFITKLTNLTSSADSSAQLNTFWSDLIATENFPFAIENEVAFLYRGSGTTINWAGMFNNWDMNANPGTRLGVSDIWIWEQEYPKDTRCEYKIVKNGSEWLADPNNPHPLVGGYGNSELWMPDYCKHTELIVRPETPKGSLSDNILKFSFNLNYSCQYRVYTPASYNSLTNLPTVYVTDGQEYLDDTIGKMIIVLDNLIADELIEPVIAVFLDPRDPNNLSNNRRGNEYRNNINFANYVTKELVPDIDAAYNTNSSPDARAIMGISYGGYNAEYFCVKAPDFFHLIGMNSPYLHPNGNYDIYADLTAANLDDMKLYLSYGIFDTDGETYYNSLKNIFDQKEKEFDSNIIGDGHTWQNWSRLTGNILTCFFLHSEPISLSLNTPNGGECYVSGDLSSIVWGNTGVSDIKIEYSTDNGSNWSLISNSTSASLGTYDWIIPNVISDQCKVRITDITNGTIFDESDNTFKIGTVNKIGGPYAVDNNTILLLHFEGDLTNQSPLSDNGIPHGSGLSYSSSALSTLGRCLKLNGGSYMSIPHNTNLNLTGDWTIEAWFYFTSMGSGNIANPTIVSKASSNSSNYFVWYHNNAHSIKGQFTNNNNNNDIYVGIAENVITTGKWYHIAYIRDNVKNVHKLVIRDKNRKIIAQHDYQYNQTLSTPVLNDEDVLIGKLFSTSNFYVNGYIDEVRISNVVRSFDASDISENNRDNLFSIYPNPSKTSVFISSHHAGTMAIYNLTGQKILKKKNFLNGRIDVSGFKKGIYVVIFLYEKGSVARKLIVE